MSDPPVVTSGADIDAHGGEVATVRGTYEQRDVRMKPVDPDELFAGNVAVVLADGTDVYLHPPGDEEAIRDADEIARCEGRVVRATGLLLECNPDENAAIMAPCLLDIESIELADD